MQITRQENVFIRAAIAKAVAGTGAQLHAEARWGATSQTVQYMKSAVSGATAGADAVSTGLAVGTISRSQFVEAVFSRSILGQLQGLVRVPAITRINIENTPSAASFVPEAGGTPVTQGNFGVYLTDKRKVGIVEVVSQELLQATDDAAESVISGTLIRALSRGLDNALVGSQVRDDTTPAGLASMATAATSFNAGIEAFTGDLTTASVLVNPLTAVTLRTPTETQITTRGGYYGGLPAIASYAIPANTLFIVDASRVLAFIGDVVIDAMEHADVYGISGSSPQIPVNMFQTAQVALLAKQYADWTFAPGAAIAVTLSAQ